MAKKHTTRRKKNQLPWAEDLDINQEFFRVLVYHFKEIPDEKLMPRLKLLFYAGVAWTNDLWYKAVTTEHKDIEKELQTFVNILDTQIKRYQKKRQNEDKKTQVKMDAKQWQTQKDEEKE